MPLSYISKGLIEELELLEPFGIGNTKPVFAQKDVHILNGRIMGKNRNVGKYWVTDGGGRFYPDSMLLLKSLSTSFLQCRLACGVLSPRTFITINGSRA